MTDIKGYRALSPAEIELVNRIKAAGEEIGKLVGELRFMSTNSGIAPGQSDEATFELDGRWVAIGATHLQEGFMALTRSVTKPTTFA